MGLDQYGYMLTGNKEEKLAQYLKNGEIDERIELAYWRKHNALHNWMHKKFMEKVTDETSDFNCVPLELSVEDLDQLYEDVLNCRLECSEGFFFGGTAYMNGYKGSDLQRDDLTFVIDAKRAIEAGNTVFYSAWY